MTNQFDSGDGHEEMEYKRFKGDMDEQAKHYRRWQAEEAQKAAMADQQKIFNEALAEAGVDQQTFNELVAIDPQGTRQAFTEGIKEYVGKIVRRRDEKGRFVPGKPQPQHGRSVQRRREQAKPKSLDGFRETTKKRALTEDEEMDVIDALLGTDTPL